MATTREPQTLSLHVCVLGERPRVFIDAGFRRWSVFFEDTDELANLLSHAVCDGPLRDRMPLWVAEKAVCYARDVIGSYEDEGRFGRVSKEAKIAERHGAAGGDGAARFIDVRKLAFWGVTLTFSAVGWCAFVRWCSWHLAEWAW